MAPFAHIYSSKLAPGSYRRAMVCVLACAWQCLALGDVAAQEPESKQEEEQTLAFYSEVSFGLGALTDDTPLMDARFALGWALVRPSGTGTRVRLGLVVDVFRGDESGASMGPEALVDRAITPRTSIGVRASLAGGSAHDPNTGSGTILMFGPHLQFDQFVFGLDGMLVTGGEKTQVGLLLGAGLGGRAGKYALGLSALAVTIGTVAFIGLYIADSNSDGSKI